MSSVLQVQAPAKGKMSVAPVQWMPGALSAMLPFFATLQSDPGVLYLRADDPNLYGVYTSGLITSPVVEKNSIIKSANKGFNFYSAPWAIMPLPCRDLGQRVEITNIHTSVTDYITSLYTLLDSSNTSNVGSGILLSNWQMEQNGYVKAYQVLQGSAYVNVSGTTYFGGAKLPNTQVSGVPETNQVMSPLITNDFTFNGTNIETYQLPYNTFFAVDTPIVLSAVDVNNPAEPRIYFTLLNNVTLFNGPNYNA
jgi:hypothetical protein